ncbi:MAG: hypothetical protein GY852_10775, partial [bacterium]|nr:hypothetical protein [bacterium]
MDFRTAIDEVSQIEKSAGEYAPPKFEKMKAERSLELSPPDIHEMEYPDIIIQYTRMEKILRASRMDAGMFGEKNAPSPEPTKPAPKAVQKEAKEIEKEMKKISVEGKKEAEVPLPPPEELKPPEEAEPSVPSPAELERAKAAEAAAHPPELPETEVQETIAPPEREEVAPAPKPETPKEEVPEGELTPIPDEEIASVPEVPTELPELEPAPVLEPEPESGAPALDIVFPAVLNESPLKKAEETMVRLETQLGGQMTGKTTKKVDVGGTKKRMLELTRELFKERSMNRRAEIKKEIVMLRGLLKGKGGKAAAGGLPKGSLYTALRDEQDMEVKEAKNRIHSIYSDNLKSLLSAMEAQRAVEHREPAFETFSKNLVHLEHSLTEIIDKYQNYLIAKHSAELAKLKARGQSTPESETLKGTLKDLYAHDFSSLKNSIGEGIHSQIETKKAVLFEEAGAPDAMMLSQVANTSEESL